jgi:nucleoside phosphorylase
MERAAVAGSAPHHSLHFGWIKGLCDYVEASLGQYLNPQGFVRRA